MKAVRILGCRVDSLMFSEALQRIASLAQSGLFQQVITGNTLMLLEAQHYDTLRSILERAALVVPESSGVMWAGRLLKTPFPDKIPGIDLFRALCAQAAEKGQSIFLLGARPGVAQSAADALLKIHPTLRIAGVHHGYFAQDEAPVLEKIRQARPTFLFVAMNVPGQEIWIASRSSQLGPVVAMGVGGSFDVLAGHLKRAPLWMQRAGIEWLYRVLQEPWRWKRIAQLPLFVWKVLKSQT